MKTSAELSNPQLIERIAELQQELEHRRRAAALNYGEDEMMTEDFAELSNLQLEERIAELQQELQHRRKAGHATSPALTAAQYDPPLAIIREAIVAMGVDDRYAGPCRSTRYRLWEALRDGKLVPAQLFVTALSMALRVAKDRGHGHADAYSRAVEALEAIRRELPS
jgi:hypothetical protein